MSGGISVQGYVCAGSDYGSVPASSSLTVLTAGTSAAKGAWYQLGTAATDTTLLHVVVNNGVANRTGIIDIGVGPSGSQVVLFANMPMRSPSASVVFDFILPCSIVAGTAIWARIASATNGSNSHSIKVDGFAGSFGLQGVSGGEAVGVSTSTCLGTLLTAPGTANTKSAWTVLGNTTHSYGSAVFFAAQAAVSVQLIDFGIGASGSEVAFLTNLPCPGNEGFTIWLPIALGNNQRISARIQSTSTTATAYVGLLGIFK